MTVRTLAHLSDLHLGRSATHEETARTLCQALQDAGVDHAVVTGDITHRGRDQEMSLFLDVFAPLIRTQRITVVPGNHDRLGDDAGQGLMEGRVAVEERPGLHLVRVDSTGDHNRSYFACHGELTEGMLEDVDRALDAARTDAMRVVMMHHHLLALPEETFIERVSERLRLPYSGELSLGRALLRRVQGRCDLVLHGHRHVPREIHLGAGTERPLTLYNAGSSTELARVRLFTHAEGRLRALPRWLWADPRRAWGPKRFPTLAPGTRPFQVPERSAV